MLISQVVQMKMKFFQIKVLSFLILFLLVRLLQNRKPFFPERNSSLHSFHMDPEAARTAQESLDLVFHMSNILDAGLDRHTLSILIALCDLGQNPEALGAVVKELRREPSSSSPMPTSSSSVH
ncbi:Mitotic-spindle organizing protein 1B [Camellia lanceoleosa]|nr:Mitotic-spindle organizing protein 1B [Camellia lanceoleosa]